MDKITATRVALGLEEADCKTCKYIVRQQTRGPTCRHEQVTGFKWATWPKVAHPCISSPPWKDGMALALWEPKE